MTQANVNHTPSCIVKSISLNYNAVMDGKVKNILLGIGSTLVIMPGGNVSQIQSPQQSDAENLAGDWLRVGQDLSSAMKHIDNEQKEQTHQ